ncbi:hypothetical protein ZIOFF_018563 [Zingiber officinale]|uniref:TRF2/HOY1 PH-like domain-containing protein n=1 Tax=Zingiber officinale TaxID=94328 RepID=A0A8J5LM74_ZINOF|nr:hypothetical protein ZIOFF_018563 [Zingiber officinale]
MVWSTDSGKRRPDSISHSAPPPPAMKLEVEEPLDEKRCMSRYEGDLVAKCYFTKRKLVWEVLEGGLKSKTEFHLSDITAIKALARPPLFFRVTDPQSRKDTLWQTTRDFTNNQAYIHRRHPLQCPQTLLSKNFEKLIDCDPHLRLYRSPFATSSISNKTETQDSFGRTPDFDSQDTRSPCSVEELASGNTSLPCDTLLDKKIMDFIAQFIDNDSQSSAQTGVGSDDEPYSTLDVELSFLEFLIAPRCDKF